MNKHLRVMSLLLLLLLPAAALAQTTTAPAPAPAPAGPAPSPQAMADAKQVIELLHLQQLPDQFALSLVQQVYQRILAVNKGKDAAIKDYIEKTFVPAVKTKLAPLEQQQQVVLATRLSGDELRQVLAFYRNGAGAKLLTAVPAMRNDMLPFAQNWAKQVMADLSPQITADLKKRNLALPK